MAVTKEPAWIAAATTAAVRLAAEAGAEVDDLLEHAAQLPEDRRAVHATRLEESAALTEVATDLAGLLWAECTDVPPIATILDEPATQAALEAVAEARRQAATRLVEGRSADEPVVELHGSLDPTVGVVLAAVAVPRSGLDTETGDAAVVVVVPQVPSAPPALAAEVGLPAPIASAPRPVTPAATVEASSRRPAAGAVLAGAAAAAILLFGRRLRRA